MYQYSHLSAVEILLLFEKTKNKFKRFDEISKTQFAKSFLILVLT